MNSVIMLENSDGTSGLDEKLKGSEGAAHVVNQDMPGSSVTYVMGGDGTAPVYTGTQIIEGLAAKEIVITPADIIDDANPILVGVSTTDSQGAAIGAKLDGLVAELTTPTASVAFSDVRVLGPSSTPEDFRFKWDGTNTIKSLAIRPATVDYASGIPIMVTS